MLVEASIGDTGESSETTIVSALATPEAICVGKKPAIIAGVTVKEVPPRLCVTKIPFVGDVTHNLW